MKIGDLVRVSNDVQPGNAIFEAVGVVGLIGVIVGPLVAGRYWQVLADKQLLFFHQNRLERIR